MVVPLSVARLSRRRADYCWDDKGGKPRKQTGSAQRDQAALDAVGAMTKK
jgi:hypothetical protein